MFFAPSGVGSPLKFCKRQGLYKASNVTFNPETCEATSFNWWYFVKRIGGKVVFNSYRYSSYTSRHQGKVQRLLDSLGIAVDLDVEAPKGLQDLGSAVSRYEYRIKTLLALIQKPGTHKAKNLERAEQVKALQGKLAEVRKLLKAGRV